MAEQIEQTRDMHLDVALDDEEDEQVQVRAPVFVDVVARSDERRPILPAALHGLDNIKASAGYHAERTWHRVRYHAVRSPWYVLLSTFWGLVGVFRLAGRLIVWAFHPELDRLLQEAVNRGDVGAGLAAERQLAERRGRRIGWVLLLLAAVIVAAVLLWLFAPRWVLVLTGLTAVPGLARMGRPRTRPIVSAAVVATRFRRLNADIVLRAYYVAGLGHPEKKDQQIAFASQMARDQRETGSQVLVDLPYGKGWDDVMNAKSKLASGLDVHANQVFLTRDKTSERRHTLFVADRDPLAVPVGHTDMLDGKPRTIWKPMRLGKDERDALVSLLVLWNCMLVGAQPRKGKTFTARLVALYCALDPWVKLFIVDGKKSTDWNKFLLVAHRFIVGTHPNPRDNDPIGHLIGMLDEILAHIDRVNDVLASLPVDLCPEGVLTEALTKDPRFPDLRFWVLIMEEFQVYFETEDQETNKKIAQKLSRIQATGPSAGVIILSSSQKPSGVGAGDVGRLFNRYRDNHTVRFALKCGNRDVSIAVLGGDSYQEGYDASALPVGLEYRGVGYLYGASDSTPTVRTFLADHVDAEKILVAARGHRERLGTLSGAAAGEEAGRQSRDVLADVIRVFAHLGRKQIQWEQLAEILAEQKPEAYGQETKDSISALVRAEGVPGKDVRNGDTVRQGCSAEHVQAAIERRQLSA